jgi:hypothetical protein
MPYRTYFYGDLPNLACHHATRYLELGKLLNRLSEYRSHSTSVAINCRLPQAVATCLKSLPDQPILICRDTLRMCGKPPATAGGSDRRAVNQVGTACGSGRFNAATRPHLTKSVPLGLIPLFISTPSARYREAVLTVGTACGSGRFNAATRPHLTKSVPPGLIPLFISTTTARYREAVLTVGTACGSGRFTAATSTPSNQVSTD